ncbi:UPF0575 protein C19orf67 homolog isoform X2 [Cheilinus undulatus]|uniref:UPF0575 protein C19orf67 homolog isoform X2 n=1 Tax=Cheilinus undulatus TaxID=241271 RepID=UPI001BD5FF7E|nr:UPF0575 protein C19orf67 homolog isoform X2 [Cheilinus undulatus]
MIGENCTEDLDQAGHGEVKDTLLLADVALLPLCGDDASCRCDSEVCTCMEVRQLERSLQSMQLQLQFLLSKADYLQNLLVTGQGDQNSMTPAEEVRRFLYTCQPYFDHVESTARSTESLCIPPPFEIHTRHVQLLDFSQQLCDRLEQLVLTCASYNLICLDEAEPNSVSHFYIGQSQLGQLRLTAFRYCEPMPYLSRINTGLYKRMRWNVERLRDETQKLQQQTDEEQDGEKREEYYFLCCEDILNSHENPAGDAKGVSEVDVVRVWSIGQWVQVNPNPDREDIFDWISCEVPEAFYQRILFLGSDEPLGYSATDHLLKLLLCKNIE